VSCEYVHVLSTDSVLVGTALHGAGWRRASHHHTSTGHVSEVICCARPQRTPLQPTQFYAALASGVVGGRCSNCTCIRTQQRVLVCLPCELRGLFMPYSSTCLRESEHACPYVYLIHHDCPSMCNTAFSQSSRSCRLCSCFCCCACSYHTESCAAIHLNMCVARPRMSNPWHLAQVSICVIVT
jgi:hypothetical protein